MLSVALTLVLDVVCDPRDLLTGKYSCRYNAQRFVYGRTACDEKCRELLPFV